MILCNCCNTDNAPMGYHRGYLICDDCVEKWGGAMTRLERQY